MSSNINKFGIKGSYELQIKNKDGSVLSDTGEQDNLILDGALEFTDPFSGSLFLTLGSGVVTEPAVTDTSLGNQVYSESVTLSSNNYTTDSNGLTARYKITEVVENTNAEFSEIGISRRGAYTNGAYPYTQLTRALIKDASGSPTTISVTSDQELHITYYVYLYMPWVIGTGVTSTPHGDLEWVYKLPYDENSSSLGKGRVAAAAKQSYGWSVSYGWYAVGRSLSEISGNDDITNRTRSTTLHGNATTSSNTTSSGSAFLRGAGGHYGTYQLFLLSDYTLPANHDFTITLQVSWGRLP